MEKNTILLVEDEAIIAMDQANMLEANGFNVIPVYTPDDAIAAVDAGSADLVLMDIDLGRGSMDGTQVAQVILSQHRIPIIFLTSHIEKEMVDRVKGITRYGYVIKNSGEFVLIEAIHMAFELFNAHQKTMESEEKYRAAFVTSPDSVNINRIDGLYVDINEGFTALTGYTREDVMGRSSTDIDIWAIPEDRNRLVKGLQKDGKVENLESVFRCKDGSLKTALMSAQIITINDEPHILSITRDITEKKEIEEKVQQSEKRFRSIFDNAADGILIGNNQGFITDANIAMTSITGYTHDELIGKNINILFTSEHLDEEPLRYNHVYKGFTVTRERKIVIKDGTEIQVLMNTSKVEDDCLQAIIHDVSHLRSAQEALRESEERFRLAVEGSRDGLWDWDLLTNDAYHSQQFATMLGYEPDDLPYTSAAWSDLLHPEDREKAFEQVNRYLEGKVDYYESTFRMKTKDGSYRWITGRGKALLDDTGKPVRFVGFNTDITAQKEQEDEVKRLLEEKEFLLREINHRVKNNLAMVSSLINLKQNAMEDNVDLSDLNRQVNAIRIIHEKLYYSQEFSSINFREYSEELFNEIFSAFTGGQVSVDLQMADIVLPLKTAIPLGLIFNEIATNAVKHGFVHGQDAHFTVKLYNSGDNDHYTIILSNSGNPFPDDIEIDQTESLGLRLVSALVEQIGGKMTLQKSPHTTFIIEFSPEITAENM